MCWHKFILDVGGGRRFVNWSYHYIMVIGNYVQPSQTVDEGGGWWVNMGIVITSITAVIQLLHVLTHQEQNNCHQNTVIMKQSMPGPHLNALAKLILCIRIIMKIQPLHKQGNFTPAVLRESVQQIWLRQPSSADFESQKYTTKRYLTLHALCLIDRLRKEGAKCPEG